MLKDRPTHHMLVVVCLSFSVAIHAAYSYCINNNRTIAPMFLKLTMRN